MSWLQLRRRGRRKRPYNGRGSPWYLRRREALPSGVKAVARGVEKAERRVRPSDGGGTAAPSVEAPASRANAHRGEEDQEDM